MRAWPSRRSVRWRSGSDVSDRQLAQTRVFLRPIANPMALGFLGTAVATLVDSGLNFQWFGLSETHQAALVILVFAPLTQLIASVFGYLSRDPAASTGMGVQAAAWLCIGLLLVTSPPGSTSNVLGTMLFVAGAGLFLVSLVCMGSKVVPALVLAGTALRWVVEGLYETGGTETWQDISGVIGVVVCALALYAVFALELEDQFKRTVLPTLRRGAARRVLVADLETDTEQVGAEAGVRSQL